MLLDVGRRTRKALDRTRRWSEIGGSEVRFISPGSLDDAPPEPGVHHREYLES